MPRSHPTSARNTAAPVNEPTRRWIVAAAKLGYAAKAVVYATIGVMALLAATHTGGHTTGSRGAFVAILSQPFGPVLLGLLSVGLAAYAIWRLLQAVMDVDHHGSTWKGLMARTGIAFVGLVYAGLAYSSLRLFFGMRAQMSDEQAAKSWTALLLAQPFGPWLVVAAGSAIV